MLVDLGRGYLELVLRLRRLAPSLVDSYSGPAELAAPIDAEPRPAALELHEQSQELQWLVGAHEPNRDRREWLRAQLAGISTALLWLAGEQFSYRELTERCHGVSATLSPQDQFELAHCKLDRVLPGRGDVRERYQRWAQTQLVPRGLLLAGLQSLAKELRRRSAEKFDLPAGERAVFELVRGKAYAGNADYRGGLRTEIAINEELPIASFRLLELVSHEAYPGHHCEHACKDADLVLGRGRVELAVWVYPTPQALLAEGIACHALKVLLSEEADEIGARCLRPLGIPYEPEIARVVREAQQLLGGVRPNIAMMLDERASPEQARAYARRWMVEDDRQVDRRVRNLEELLWRPYESCYTDGLALCQRFTNSDPSRFRRLLHEQLTPSDLL